MPCCVLMGGGGASRYKPLCNSGWLCTNAMLCANGELCTNAMLCANGGLCTNAMLSTHGGLCTNGVLFRGGTLSASRRCLALRKLRCNTGGNAAGVLCHRPVELSQGWLRTHGVLCTNSDTFLNPCSCGLSGALDCTPGWQCCHWGYNTPHTVTQNPKRLNADRSRSHPWGFELPF